MLFYLYLNTARVLTSIAALTRITHFTSFIAHIRLLHCALLSFCIHRTLTLKTLASQSPLSLNIYTTVTLITGTTLTTIIYTTLSLSQLSHHNHHYLQYIHHTLTLTTLASQSPLFLQFCQGAVRFISFRSA